jgi:hypothetical protein
MNTVVPDQKYPASPPQGAVAIRLVQHRDVPAHQIAPAKSMRGERPRDAQLVATPAYQPTAAECYGCVDWFQF